MDGDGFDFGDPAARVIFELSKKNHLAQNITIKYTRRHQRFDIALGIIGLAPGLGLPALIAAVAAQAALIYPPMAREIGNIYLADPDEISEVNSEILTRENSLNATLDVSADLGVDFLMMIASEIFLEVGVGAAITAIPIIGGAAAVYLDYAIAKKMTPRVARMTSMFYQNQGRWLNNSQEQTYKAARDMDGDFESIRYNIAEVRKTQLATMKSIIKMMLPAIGIDKIRQILLVRGLPEDLIDEALAAF